MLPLRAYRPSLPLLLLLFFGILIPLAIAGFIAENILDTGLFHFEQSFMLWLHHNIGSVFAPVAVVLHHIGKTAVAAPLVILFAVWLFFRKQRGHAVFALFAAALPTAIMSAAKRFFNRPRPEFWPRIIEETGASFPSGHSTFAAAFATMVVLIYWQSPNRTPIIAAAVTFAFLMGLSRMVLGVHYPTDVLVGWITGTSTVIGLYLVLFRKLPGKP